ncbi:MAG: DegV family EDD domain-containing protein, partial [Candidatus Aenigmarchaeota archaeon]|nr:DegV family EDD domain-containing protein [Candidatus Aenigmarchaeota archaeon]
MFEVIIDATCDLEEKYKKQARIVPLYIIDERIGIKIPITTDYSVFYDDESLRERWYNGKLKTSQPSLEDFMKAIRESECDDILIITISSKLSGTYNVAMNAKKKTKEKNIVVFDTLNASIGAGLYIKKALELREKGYGIEEVVRELKKLDVRLYLVTDDIKYLLNSGRVSKLKYAFLRLTKLVPIL